MKTKLKNLLFLAALFPFFMVSCNSDDSNGAATITFDSVNSSAQVSATGTLVVKGTIKSKEGTTIESIIAKCLYGDGASTDIATTLKEFTEGTAKNEYSFVFTEESKGISSHLTDITGVQITVQVKNGDESSKTWAIVPYSEPEPTDTPLGSAVDFEWARIGGAAGTGLDQFGLSWTENTSTVAIVKNSNATKFVKLSSSSWADIETQEDLAAAITAGTDMDDFREISVTASQTYNITLGVRNNDVDYMIHLTNATISSSTSGTVITITGQYKK